jgi:hypothetical protein
MANRSITASGDGDTLVVPSSEPLILSFSKPVILYDATAGVLTQSSETTTYSGFVSVSRTGARMLIRTLATDNLSDTTAKVYDFNAGTLSLRGTLPSGLANFVITPDGNTAYAYYSSTTKVRKFDLTAPSGGSFPEIGTGTVISSPGTFDPAMTISPDGGTLFLASNQQVVIVPAP